MNCSSVVGTPEPTGANPDTYIIVVNVGTKLSNSLTLLGETKRGRTVTIDGVVVTDPKLVVLALATKLDNLSWLVDAYPYYPL